MEGDSQAERKSAYYISNLWYLKQMNRIDLFFFYKYAGREYQLTQKKRAKICLIFEQCCNFISF